MRTTIDLPDDLHRQVKAIARDTGRTFNETIAEVVRRGLAFRTGTEVLGRSRTGLPVIRVGTVITSEDVRSLEDEW